MLFTTTPLLHRVLTVNASRRDSLVMGCALYLGLAVFLIYHAATDELIMHFTIFVGSVAVIGIRTFQLVQLRTPSNSVARRQIWGMVRFGACEFITSLYDYGKF